MMPPPQSFISDEAAYRRWRAAMLWTIHDLRLSMARRRRLSLPNLCRLFEYRWRKANLDEKVAMTGAQIGRAFLKSMYPIFTAAPGQAPSNGHSH